jgi:hypothetical protein
MPNAKLFSSNKLELPATFLNGRNIWILKATGFNRGIGIHVFSNINELTKLFNEYTLSQPFIQGSTDQLWRSMLVLRKYNAEVCQLKAIAPVQKTDTKEESECETGDTEGNTKTT